MPQRQGCTAEVRLGGPHIFVLKRGLHMKEPRCGGGTCSAKARLHRRPVHLVLCCDLLLVPRRAGHGVQPELPEVRPEVQHTHKVMPYAHILNVSSGWGPAPGDVVTKGYATRSLQSLPHGTVALRRLHDVHKLQLRPPHHSNAIEHAGEHDEYPRNALMQLTHVGSRGQEGAGEVDQPFAARRASPAERAPAC
jgi:hypothetical protein